MDNLYGLAIRESVHAVTISQWRVHKKQPWHSDSYHKRVMKKWLKRFGVRHVPAMYKIGAAIAGRETLVVHPDLMPRLRAELGKHEQEVKS